MVILSIHYTFAPEDADKVEALFHELREAARREAGCITFNVARSKEQPNVFALWEEYVDEAAVEAHQATEHFQRLALNGVRKFAKERLAQKVYPID